jgi:hypothetical protein
MVLLVAVALAVMFSIARRYEFAPVMRVNAQWERVRPFVVSYVRASPATFIYLMILMITTLVMVTSSNQVVALLLQEHSTNLTELFSNPLRVVILSAFWAPNYEFLVWAILFALVLAPAERWLGTRRWAIVFIAGHVIATVGVAWGLWLAIRHGYASRHLENAIDVGVSYGFAAVAAVFSYRLPNRWRWWWALALVVTAVSALAIGRTFTDAGHLLAVCIGFACYPLSQSDEPRSRISTPIWLARPKSGDYPTRT